MVVVGQVIHSAACAPHMLYPEHEQLEAILRDDGNRMTFLGDQAAKLLDRVIVKLAEGVKVGDLLVVEESGRCSLSEGKDTLKHRDRVVADVRIQVVVLVARNIFFIVVIQEEVLVVVTFILVFLILSRFCFYLRFRRRDNTASASHDQVSIDRRQSSLHVSRCESAAVLAAVSPVDLGLINKINTPTIRCRINGRSRRDNS